MNGLNRRCSGSKKPAGEEDATRSGKHWLHAANLYAIAAYPHLKGDELAEQAQALANRAYEEAAQRLPGQMRELEFTIPGGAPVTGFLHMPEGDGPFPTVLMCGGLDSLQIDYYSQASVTRTKADRDVDA